MTPEDLVAYGLTPEFVRRFGVITHTDPLSQDVLARILTEPEHAPVRIQREWFELHDLTLSFTPEATRAIAERACRDGTGASGLARIVQQCLADVSWRLPELAEEGVSRVTITEATVASGVPPILDVDLLRPDPSSLAEELRSRVRLARGAETMREDERAISDTSGWSAEQIRDRLELLKQDLGWPDTTDNEKAWWSAFETENSHKLRLVLCVAEELKKRDATIGELFMTHVHSDMDSIQGNLHFLDYTRLKREEEQKKEGRFPSGATCPAGKGGTYTFVGFYEPHKASPQPEPTTIEVAVGEVFPKAGCRRCWWQPVV